MMTMLSLSRRVIRDVAMGFEDIANSWIGDAVGLTALFGGLGAFLWVAGFLAWEAAQ